jgi:hypothetical protein
MPFGKIIDEVIRRQIITIGGYSEFDREKTHAIYGYRYCRLAQHQGTIYELGLQEYFVGCLCRKLIPILPTMGLLISAAWLIFPRERSIYKSIERPGFLAEIELPKERRILKLYGYVYL